MLCPACTKTVQDRALRCRHCGAEMPRKGTASGWNVAEAMPIPWRALELLDEASGISPEVVAWWRKAPPATRRRLVAILAELHRLIGI